MELKLADPLFCDRKNEVRTIFDEEQFCSIEWWPNWLGIAVLAVNRRHAWQMSQILYKLKRHQTPHKMNKYTWLGISLFLTCTFGRKQTYHPNVGKRQYIETKLVNPRISPSDVNSRRVKRSPASGYSERVIEQEDGDIDIEIDTNQITVHTADHQLSINLLGRLFVCLVRDGLRWIIEIQILLTRWWCPKSSLFQL